MQKQSKQRQKMNINLVNDNKQPGYLSARQFRSVTYHHHHHHHHQPLQHTTVVVPRLAMSSMTVASSVSPRFVRQVSPVIQSKIPPITQLIPTSASSSVSTAAVYPILTPTSTITQQTPSPILNVPSLNFNINMENIGSRIRKQEQVLATMRELRDKQIQQQRQRQKYENIRLMTERDNQRIKAQKQIQIDKQKQVQIEKQRQIQIQRKRQRQRQLERQRQRQIALRQKQLQKQRQLAKLKSQQIQQKNQQLQLQNTLLFYQLQKLTKLQQLRNQKQHKSTSVSASVPPCVQYCQHGYTPSFGKQHIQNNTVPLSSSLKYKNIIGNNNINLAETYDTNFQSQLNTHNHPSSSPVYNVQQHQQQVTQRQYCQHSQSDNYNIGNRMRRVKSVGQFVNHTSNQNNYRHKQHRQQIQYQPCIINCCQLCVHKLATDNQPSSYSSQYNANKHTNRQTQRHQCAYKQRQRQRQRQVQPLMKSPSYFYYGEKSNKNDGYKSGRHQQHIHVHINNNNKDNNKDNTKDRNKRRIQRKPKAQNYKIQKQHKLQQYQHITHQNNTIKHSNNINYQQQHQYQYNQPREQNKYKYKEQDINQLIHRLKKQNKLLKVAANNIL